MCWRHLRILSVSHITTVTENGVTREIVWKAEEDADGATITVYDPESDTGVEYSSDGTALYDGKTGRSFVRPEPDNLEIVDYDKAQKVNVEAFTGVWELTDLVVTLVDPPMTVPMGAEVAFALLSSIAGVSFSGPVRLDFNVGGNIIGVQSGEVIERNFPQLSYYFDGKALYVRPMGSAHTMVFFHVGNDTLHLIVTPNPTPDAGTCVIIFKQVECLDFFVPKSQK